ncbi:restriction endonuclease subunit S [Nocardia caishijiensis]|nr:restriction endonuclease subunit S [Nocardia caishijiensis]
MRGNIINLSEARQINEITFKEWTSRLRPQAGDLLLAREAPVGPVVRIPVEENVAPGQRTVLIRPNALIVDPRYMYYYLISPQVQAELMARAEGSTVAHLNVADIRNFPVEVPPELPQQLAIAEVLGALDDKIAANDRAASLAIELSDSLFRRVIERGHGDSVTIKQLAEKRLLEFSDGYRTKRAELDATGLRILRAGDIRDNRVFSSGPDFVAEEYRAKIGGKASAVNDVVITTKGTVGRVAVVLAGVEGNVYSPQLCYIRVSGPDVIAPSYVAAWLRSANARGQMANVMHKSDMAPYINLKDVGALEMPWGDEAIRNGLSSRLTVLMNYFHALGAENGKLSDTRDELLPLLMSGKLRVKDAEQIVEKIV